MPDLSLQDMLKIMDVARELRQDRELVQQELSHEERVSRLKERLLASTELTGETATPEEIDAAIDLYFDNLHAFREPAFSVQVLLAHLYIRRWTLLFAGALVLLVSVGLWSLFLAPQAPFSRTNQRTARIALQQQELQQQVNTLRELTSQPELREQIESLFRRASRSIEESQPTAYQAAVNELNTLEQALLINYEVRIVQSGQSAARRDYSDESGTRVSGFYVIVEAITPQGQTVAVTVQDRETGTAAVVRKWGEQVPQEVYERLKSDKLADGVLDERAFAEKPRGQLDWVMKLPGLDGQPLPRGGQIINW